MFELITGLLTGGASGIFGILLRNVQTLISGYNDRKNNKAAAEIRVQEMKEIAALKLDQAFVGASKEVGVPPEKGVANFFNSMVRPTITYTIFGIWSFIIISYIVAYGKFDSPEALASLAVVLNTDFGLTVLLGTITGYWFASREALKSLSK